MLIAIYKFIYFYVSINRGNTPEDPASNPNTLIKNKVSRAPRTGSVGALESSNIQPSSTTFPGW